MNVIQTLIHDSIGSQHCGPSIWRHYFCELTSSAMMVWELNGKAHFQPILVTTLKASWTLQDDFLLQGSYWQIPKHGWLQFTSYSVPASEVGLGWIKIHILTHESEFKHNCLNFKLICINTALEDKIGKEKKTEIKEVWNIFKNYITRYKEEKSNYEVRDLEKHDIWMSWKKISKWKDGQKD